MTKNTMTGRRNLLVLLLVAGLALTGCAAATEAPSPAPTTVAASSTVDQGEFLETHGLSGLDAAQIVDKLDRLPVAEQPTDLMASVRPDHLLLTDAQEREVSLPMPTDEVYISIAPYRNQTHDCYFHSLTTCKGELANSDVQLTITSDDGKVLLDDTRQTYDNGFVGIWLPRGIRATLTVEHDGHTGSQPISTVNVDDATCITTLKLA